jgi:peptidoglycan/xylan/chitin deacetylase (PgdA/CDA1 family)
MDRREFLRAGLGAGVVAGIAKAAPATDGKALIAITLDLEMSRNFPTWDQTHWDYEKGNLDNDTKKYAVEAARRVKAHGSHIHFFALGQTMEQDDVSWLKEIIAEGHPVGNHTYDHVHVKAKTPAGIQFRFQRAPWLVEGKTANQIIGDNIRLAEKAFHARLGIKPAGFRTPGGFVDGLADRPDLQAMLLEMGYTWVSSKYPAHPIAISEGKPPDGKTVAGIIAAQQGAQPFVYPKSGLVELPMSPISDVGAFRNGRWPLDSFVETIKAGVSWAIEQRAVFSFLGHPSCLVATDPGFRTIDAICELVAGAGERAQIVTLESTVSRAKPAG